MRKSECGILIQPKSFINLLSKRLGILQKLGAIAGIAGISLGIFVIIFRDVIKKIIVPGFTKRQAFNVIRLILLLTWSIAVLGIVVYAFSSRNGPKAKTDVNEQDLGKGKDSTGSKDTNK